MYRPFLSSVERLGESHDHLKIYGRATWHGLYIIDQEELAAKLSVSPMSRRSTGSFPRYNQDSSEELTDCNAYPLRSLARNRSIQSRINTVGLVHEDQPDDNDFVASPKSMKRSSVLGFWGSSGRKSRDSDGPEEDPRTSPGSRREMPEDEEYDGGYMSRGSVEQERLLRSSAGVEGGWANGTGGGHRRKPVSTHVWL